jgi:hypothetical protein
VKSVETDLAQVAIEIARAAGLLARLQRGRKDAELPSELPSIS